MWFLLRMSFWLGVVLVLLASLGPQPVPKSQISAAEALAASKEIVADIQQFCQRQREACVVGSQATVTLGRRAEAGAKILYEFLSERFGSDESRPVRTTGSAPVLPARTLSQRTLRPADLVPPWGLPPPTP